MLKAPPVIKHQGPPPRNSEGNDILEIAMCNFKLPSAAKRLMRYYSSQSSGFRPSLELVQRKTGINKFNISRTRSYLEKTGFIYHDDNMVMIDWKRIWIFSTLSPLKMGLKKDWSVSKLKRLPPPVFKSKIKDDKIWKLALLVEEYLKDGNQGLTEL